MKRIFIGAVALLTIVLSTSLNVSAQELGQTIPTISVNGSAQIKALPDEIYITIKLDESDTKGRVTLEEQRRNMFAALKKAGVDAEKQLSVVDMNSSYYRRGSLAATQYELKVATAEAVGRVFEALDKAGIPNVNVARTACSNIEALRSEARKAAMVDAQKRARELAEAVEQSVGACYEINDYTTTTQPVVYRSNKLMMASGAALDGATTEPEPNVEFEQIVISYNISAKFLLNLK